MVYKFTPKSEEELNVPDILEPGEYNFEVLSSEDDISQSGNPINKVKLAIFNDRYKIGVIYDYIIFSDKKFCERKVRHFAHSVGLHSQYEKGELQKDFKGLTGKLKLSIQDEKPKPNGDGFYPRKNIVEDYIPSENKKTEEGFLNDEIPF